MKAPKIRQKYTGRVSHSLVFAPESSLTKQSFAKEANINNIMAKYYDTGVITNMSRIQPQFADISNFPQSYTDAVNLVADAQEAFYEMPSRVRAHFKNDPGEFLAAINDPSKQDLLIELGLMEVAGTAPVAPGAEPDPGPHPGAENPPEQ